MDNNENKSTEFENQTTNAEGSESNAPVATQASDKSKESITKKWWFWTIIVVIVIALIAGAGGGGSGDQGTGDASSSSDTSTSNNSSSKIWKSSGTYKVGKDIEAGEYFVQCNSYNCYIQVSSDSSGSFDSIIANDNISTHTYITVREGEYLTVTGGKFTLATNIDPQTPNSDGTYGEGMYKVGKDIPAGEYKIVATNNCYIEVSSSSNHTFSSIIANDNIEVGTSTYITVSNGQYLKVNGGKIIIQ